jgi:hypothetical protein
MLPTCHFASLPTASTARSIFNSATDPRFAPRSAASTLQIRCSFHDQLDLPLPQPPLPFGTVTSLRIKAFCRLAASQPAFRFRPISVRSPLPCSITSCGYGSTFPVRRRAIPGQHPKLNESNMFVPEGTVPLGFCCGGCSSTAGYVPGNEARCVSPEGGRISSDIALAWLIISS